MAAVNGDGANGAHSTHAARFSAVPNSLSVPSTQEGGYEIEISLEEGDIQDDPTELCDMLETERSPKDYWMTVAIAYAKHKKVDLAIEVLTNANTTFGRGLAEDRLSILNGLCWLYLLKCREAPRMRPESASEEEVKTKDHYIQAATSVLNDASRINPSYPPLFLARGVLLLLRASIKGPSTTAGGPTQISSERADTLQQAAKCFEDALRVSGGKNLMAKLGKARVSYSLGKYAEALKGYQTVLESSPDLTDPDPRIGIGCCFWQLGFKEDAASAWQRSLDLNPHSKIALILLGIYTFQLTAHLLPSDPEFMRLAKKALSEYVGPSAREDNMYPLTCATLGSWYSMRREFGKVEKLARRAIELTDVNDIASDGWYQLAKNEHDSDNTDKAMSYYTKADQARGGNDRGYIPAKFGSAQMRVLIHDFDGAKFRLEKILQQQPNTFEAQTLLGTLYAEDVFSAQAGNSKEDKSAELKKALKYLEDVSRAWKDPKKKVAADQAVLLNLARLYEADHPDKSLKCLEEVEQLEMDAIPEDDYPEDVEDEQLRKALLRELLPPQLLNNMGCFHYQNERYVQARELFQTALNACVKAAQRDETIDTDALVTSISYNLGRTYESEGMLNEAKEVYNNLLKRHADYVDARIRLAYINLQQHPTDEGPKAVAKLNQDHKDNLEVRALYGWYLNKSKKRVLNIAEDQEQRHYKHTLQGGNGANKHNQYALTGLGNIHLVAAREMRGTVEQEKEKRRKTYEKAVEFFEKVLQVDGKNAYAAQGIAIALVEDKKDFATALQIFTKVKETLKDYNVYMNLGHTYCELKQYNRAIENYEAALSKRQHDSTILACLGRVWLLRGKHEKSLSAEKTSLEYSQRALEMAPEQVHFKFNVAFVQMQIAQLVITLKDSERSLAEVETAAQGLENAIETFSAIAKSPNPPFPAHDIEQRASMGRNTMRKQLERVKESQQRYEEANHSKLEQARALREAEIKRREEEQRKAEEAAAERKRKIQEEQERLRERDREHMEKRAEEERRRRELIDDSNIQRSEKKERRKGGKRKKKGDDDSETEGNESEASARPRRRRTTDASGTEGASDEERPREKKKRRLERKKKEPVSKYKSSEMVVDSDDEDAGMAAPRNGTSVAGADESPEESGDEETTAAPRGRKTARVVDEDEDEDEDADGGAAGSPKAKDQDVAMEDDEDE